MCFSKDQVAARSVLSPWKLRGNGLWTKRCEKRSFQIKSCEFPMLQYHTQHVYQPAISFPFYLLLVRKGFPFTESFCSPLTLQPPKPHPVDVALPWQQNTEVPIFTSGLAEAGRLLDVFFFRLVGGWNDEKTKLPKIAFREVPIYLPEFHWIIPFFQGRRRASFGGSRKNAHKTNLWGEILGVKHAEFAASKPSNLGACYWSFGKTERTHHRLNSMNWKFLEAHLPNHSTHRQWKLFSNTSKVSHNQRLEPDQGVPRPPLTCITNPWWCGDAKNSRQLLGWQDLSLLFNGQAQVPNGCTPAFGCANHWAESHCLRWYI